MRRLLDGSLLLFAFARLHFTMRRSRATALSLRSHNLLYACTTCITTAIVDDKMSALIAAIIDCITGASAEDNHYPDQKQALTGAGHARPLDEVAEDVVNTILRTEKASAGLKAELDTIVGPYGWKEYLAEKVLEKLGAALQGAHDKLGPAIRDAYHKAWKAANEIEGFVIQHPVMCTIIALGVLIVIAPWVIEALGFAELGPVEGAYTEGSKPEIYPMLTMSK